MFEKCFADRHPALHSGIFTDKVNDFTETPFNGNETFCDR